MAIDLSGQKIISRGRLQYDEDTIRLYVPNVGLCEIEGLEQCQTVFGNEILLIGEGIGENRIRLIKIDDLPTENNSEAMNNTLFIPMLTDSVDFCAAVRGDFCDPEVTENGIRLTCDVNYGAKRESLTAEIAEKYLPQGIIGNDPKKDEEELERWLGEQDVLVFYAKYEDVSIDKEKRSVVLRNAKYV